jgi:iron complex outermembrane receptor protein
MNSSYDFTNVGASLGAGNAATNYAVRARSLAKSAREDKNQVLQLDLIGAEVNTGFLKHTFQVGFDWKQTDVTTTSYQSKV